VKITTQPWRYSIHSSHEGTDCREARETHNIHCWSSWHQDGYSEW